MAMTPRSSHTLVAATSLALLTLAACSGSSDLGTDAVGGAMATAGSGGSTSNNPGQPGVAGSTNAGSGSGAAGTGSGTGASAGGVGGGSAGGASGGAAGTGGVVDVPGGLSVRTDTNRDGTIDGKDRAGLMEWAMKGPGAFFIANTDDDDKKGKVDASDIIVNGAADEKDLARISIEVSPELLPKTSRVSVSVPMGGDRAHVFEKSDSGWTLVKGALNKVAARTELGIEATQFANTDWDGFVSVRVELLDSSSASLASQQVKLRVAPWIMLPNSAKTELVYISSQTSALKPDIDAVLTSKGLPAAKASNPGNQDVWFQDTMEIGYTQLPGSPPVHVVMKAQRPNASDDVAPTLLAPNFGYISIGEPREPGDEEDHWMDWMGNLEVTHPVPGYPLGRIYYGHSSRTTFHPTIVKFLEAQGVQKPFTIDTEWLIIQHVDEVMNFVPDKNGKAKMYIVSPAAANTVLGSGYDAGNKKIQEHIDAAIKTAKTELGLTDADIIQLPTFFEGSGTDWAPKWSSPSNAVYVNGTLMIGNSGTPAAVKTDIEQKLTAIGVEVSWVDDSEYNPGGGNVHCGTNTAKTPICPQFTDCLP